MISKRNNNLRLCNTHNLLVSQTPIRHSGRRVLNNRNTPLLRTLHLTTHDIVDSLAQSLAAGPSFLAAFAVEEFVSGGLSTDGSDGKEKGGGAYS